MTENQTAEILEFTKTCRSCGEVKEVSCFGFKAKCRGGKKYQNSQCNDCKNKYNREYNKGNRPVLLEKKKQVRLMTDPAVLAANKKRWVENSKKRPKITPEIMKCCSCKEEKHFTQFYVHSSSPIGRNDSCKVCMSKKQKEYVSNNESFRKRRNVMGVVRHRIKKYGVSPDVFSSILLAQDKKCAICKSDLDGSSFSLKPQLDHCHATGKVRGILCGKCNTALGGFKDNENILISAISYLSKYRCSP